MPQKSRIEPITDDCDAEKNALKSTWPHSTQLLCIFHYLQSWWRWLWNNEHSIEEAAIGKCIQLTKHNFKHSTVQRPTFYGGPKAKMYFYLNGNLAVPPK